MEEKRERERELHGLSASVFWFPWMDSSPAFVLLYNMRLERLFLSYKPHVNQHGAFSFRIRSN
jgi:hypothetical protein